MQTLTQMQNALLRQYVRAQNRLWRQSERGDVPGWVLIAVMSAALVTAIYGVAGGALVEKFREAIDSAPGT